MLIVNALTKGMAGGYMALSLLVSAGALTRLDDPQAATAFLEQARWVPGAARLEMALRDAQAKQSGRPTFDTPPDASLSPLQKLRQRTYVDPTVPTPRQKQ